MTCRLQWSYSPYFCFPFDNKIVFLRDQGGQFQDFQRDNKILPVLCLPIKRHSSLVAGLIFVCVDLL